MSIDPIVFWLVAAAFLVWAVIWGIMFCVLWVLDRLSGWIHRLWERRRVLR